MSTRKYQLFFSQHIIDQYKLREKVHTRYVYLELCIAVYGLPQSGVLANNNKRLREKLAPQGYYKVAHTSGLWRHVTQP